MKHALIVLLTLVSLSFSLTLDTVRCQTVLTLPFTNTDTTWELKMVKDSFITTVVGVNKFYVTAYWGNKILADGSTQLGYYSLSNGYTTKFTDVSSTYIQQQNYIKMFDANDTLYILSKLVNTESIYPFRKTVLYNIRIRYKDTTWIQAQTYIGTRNNSSLNETRFYADSAGIYYQSDSNFTLSDATTLPYGSQSWVIITYRNGLKFDRAPHAPEGYTNTPNDTTFNNAYLRSGIEALPRPFGIKRDCIYSNNNVYYSYMTKGLQAVDLNVNKIYFTPCDTMYLGYPSYDFTTIWNPKKNNGVYYYGKGTRNIKVTMYYQPEFINCTIPDTVYYTDRLTKSFDYKCSLNVYNLNAGVDYYQVVFPSPTWFTNADSTSNVININASNVDTGVYQIKVRSRSTLGGSFATLSWTIRVKQFKDIPVVMKDSAVTVLYDSTLNFILVATDSIAKLTYAFDTNANLTVSNTDSAYTVKPTLNSDHVDTLILKVTGPDTTIAYKLIITTVYKPSTLVEQGGVTKTEVFQNSPNPFNPSTQIRYNVAQNSLVKITVYSINGKVIKVLEDAQKSSGRYSITFDGNGISSGIYICKIQIGNFNKNLILNMIK